jgi:GNAT superfamily N-acetyltransferase
MSINNNSDTDTAPINPSSEKTQDSEFNLPEQIEVEGIDSLVVDDLTESDLDDLEWAGDALHIEAIREALERARHGDVDYLAVRAADGKVIAKGGIDYTKIENSGYMWQLKTMEALRGLGIGTKLIIAMEDRIKSRGLGLATLGVETDNPMARSLYERLGYVVYDHVQDSWQKVDQSGQPQTHYAEVDLMQKHLA